MLSFGSINLHCLLNHRLVQDLQRIGHYGIKFQSLNPHRFPWTQTLRIFRMFLGMERFGSIWIDDVYSTMKKLELITKLYLSNVYSIFFNIISCGFRTSDNLSSAFSTGAKFLARKEPRNVEVIPRVPWKWIYYAGPLCCWKNWTLKELESIHSAVHLVLHIVTTCDI